MIAAQICLRYWLDWKGRCRWIGFEIQGTDSKGYRSCSRRANISKITKISPFHQHPYKFTLKFTLLFEIATLFEIGKSEKKGKKGNRERKEGKKDLVLDSKSNPDRVAVKRVAGRSISGETRTRGRDGRASILSLFPARRSHVPARWTLCSAVTCSTLVNKIIIVSTR